MTPKVRGEAAAPGRCDGAPAGFRGRPPTTQLEAPAGRSTADRPLFPHALAARFDRITPLQIFGREADCYLVGDPPLFVKVYRSGRAPDPAVLARLEGAAPDKVARVAGWAEPGEDGDPAWELLDYMPLGTLCDLGLREGPLFPRERVREILFEIADALGHIHMLGIEHRDLKPANVLVRSLEPLELVLADFGMATILDDDVHFAKAGPPHPYAPPEAESGAVYRGKWDCWSLGILLVEMLTGRHPLTAAGVDLNRAIRLGGLGPFPALGDPEILVSGIAEPSWRTLCHGLLRRDPRERWTIREVMAWL